MTSISINSGGALVRPPARNTLEKTGVKGRSSRTSGMVFDTPRGIKLKSNLTSSVGKRKESSRPQASWAQRVGNLLKVRRGSGEQG